MSKFNGLSQSACQSSVSFLKQLLSDTYILYLKTQNFHWNVEGPYFYTLHSLFEAHYTELAGTIDEIAERIRALGHYAPGTFQEFQSCATIKEPDGVPNDQAMLDQLANDHERIAKNCREAAQMIEENRDLADDDLIARRISVHEKSAWMLRSQLTTR